MKKIFFVLYILNFINPLFAQIDAEKNTLALYSTIKEKLPLGLKYLETTQRKETNPGHTYRGEWQTYMALQKSFFYLGSKNKVDDSNCFSVASIHNSLANIYINYPEYENISGMLDLAFEKILTYKNGDRFNFWNLLTPNIKLKKDDVIGAQALVRRPTNYKLKTRYINNAANVTEDSDDTALSYLAIALRKKYKKSHDSLMFEVTSIAPIFEMYRDTNRKNCHWYNYMFGYDRRTGAYLTWLGNEYEFERWNALKVLGHNATFYLPISECCPRPYVPYIPYGTNDLDGVVNANVLNALSHYDELDAKGVTSSIRYIEKKSKGGVYDRVAIYYPNRYQFPYAVCKAYAGGVDSLKRSTEYLISFLINSQHEDGSWSARRVVNKRDVLQSTAYALNALAYIGDFENKGTLESVEKAIKYILENSIRDEKGIYWEGGVFFSGGTVVRNFLVWKSDAYTTAIILEAFSNYRKYVEQKYDLNIDISSL